jgi:hypothetical protein
VKMNLRWLAVTLLVATISIPATLFAAADTTADGSTSVTHPSPMDGNPNPTGGH